MSNHEPHEIDVYVGRQVYLGRRAVGVSQSTLAAVVGVSFQQIQKYERGRNRISSSVLWRIAHFLQLPIGTFFPPPIEQGSPQHEYVDAGGIGRAAAALPAPQQQLVLQLVKALTGPADRRSQANDVRATADAA